MRRFSVDFSNKIHLFIIFSMADGIEQAAIVCCFITSKYQSSPYCKKELLYAENQKIPVIPCLMDKDPQWMPTSWLGYTIIDILYLDFRDLLTDMSDANLDAKCDQLISRIKGTLARTQPVSILKRLSSSFSYLFHHFKKTFPIELCFLFQVELVEESAKEKPIYDLDDDEFPI